MISARLVRLFVLASFFLFPAYTRGDERPIVRSVGDPSVSR